MTEQVGWRIALRRSPMISAWPFVVVICAQMAFGGFSVYTLSAIRAYVTGESLWSKGQHDAVYFLDRYLDSESPEHLQRFLRAMTIPLADREGREFLEQKPINIAAASAALLKAGNAPEDVPELVWMFHYFRGFPYFERAIARWKETDPRILELDRLGRSVAGGHSKAERATLRERLDVIAAAIEPRAIAFSSALGDGARFVEQVLLLVNFVLAGILAVLTIWRVGRFLSQRRDIEGVLAWQASHDELTGLANRRAFEERLAQVLKSGLDGSPTCALMFVDLDQFKIVNDTCGHAAGDELLRRICPALQRVLDASALLGRLGGDEFSILVPKADMTSALSLAERVRAAVEKVEFVWDGRRFTVTASVGLVHRRAGDTSPDEMMRAADMACFMAKEKGRNRVHVHRESDRELLGRMGEMNWVQRIHQALNEDRFCLYAQEIAPLARADGAGLHVELLVRMRDEAGGVVPPSSFLPAAERFGLAPLVDRWVVRQAFRTLADRRALRDTVPITCCGLNLSGETIGDDSFLAFLKEAFATYAVSPHTICFEVTETSAIVNLDAARAFIHDLRGLGCTFALDDFGSGMSSFNYLKELPVDFLKIDGAFVRNLLTDRADRAMVEMINHVGHVMGKRIVAEFVETEELADALRDIGVDFGQGYGIAIPKPFTPRFQTTSRARLAARPRNTRLIA